MRNPIKIHIKKMGLMKITWMKYYLMEKLIIEEGGPIQTEAQLCWYIYKKYGAGRYQLLAWQDKHKGFWIYWIGDLNENGFIRDINKNKELDKLQGRHFKAKSYEERQDIEEEMEFIKEIGSIEKTMGRRGPIGIIKSKPGILHSYEEIE